MHWDRQRFQLVLKAYQQKYKRPFSSKILSEMTGHFRDLLKRIISSATLPEPTPSVTERDEWMMEEARTLSPMEEEQTEQVSELEATGELVEQEGMYSSTTTFLGDESLPHEFDESVLPTPPSPVFAPAMATRPPLLATSSSSTSSLASRQRTSPLEPIAHRPASANSHRQSFDRPPSALRARPIAPGRARRSSTDITVRPGSEEPMSPPLLPASTSYGSLFTRSISPAFDTFSVDRRASRPASALSNRAGRGDEMMEDLLSPRAKLDTMTSYVEEGYISPIADLDEDPFPSLSFALNELPPSHTSATYDLPTTSSEWMRRVGSKGSSDSNADNFIGEGEGFLSTQGALLTTTSPMGDPVQMRLVHELGRRLKEAEMRLQANEEEHSELEDRLEEVRIYPH